MTAFEEQATKYARRIRNLDKRAYADDYIAYMVGKRGPPADQTYKIDAMARCMVRIRLSNITQDTR